MIWMIAAILATGISAFLITTIVDIIIMGSYRLMISPPCEVSEYIVCKENRIDIQQGNGAQAMLPHICCAITIFRQTEQRSTRKCPSKTLKDVFRPAESRKYLKVTDFMCDTAPVT